jgi:copper chaperone NosL
MIKFIFTLLLVYSNLFGHKGIFQSVPEKDAVLLQKGEEKNSCLVCGMDIPMFYKTSHAIKFKDGTYRQYCSLNCMVDDMEFGDLKAKKEQITQVLVVDAKTIKLIDAKKAFYVVGSKKPGTMSMTSKYAFENEDDAKEFHEKNGGKILNYENTYALTLDEFKH